MCKPAHYGTLALTHMPSMLHSVRKAAVQSCVGAQFFLLCKNAHHGTLELKGVSSPASSDAHTLCAAAPTQHPQALGCAGAPQSLDGFCRLALMEQSSTCV
eukprot:scaffold73637_cov21-Tisochrysis_lutea.AAC.3